MGTQGRKFSLLCVSACVLYILLTKAKQYLT